MKQQESAHYSMVPILRTKLTPFFAYSFWNGIKNISRKVTVTILYSRKFATITQKAIRPLEKTKNEKEIRKNDA